MQNLIILGRQPALGLAELESLYGGDVVRPLSTAAVVDGEIDFLRLGGALKAGTVLLEAADSSWPALERQILKLVPELLASLDDGKIRLGLSLYGFNIPGRQQLGFGLTLKNSFKKAGRSVRLVPNTEAALNSASTIHNQLTGPSGCELLVVRHNGRVIVARATDVQDIDAYTKRDRGRPKRDARVGMLPPKLAQTIINLASGPDEGQPRTVLDPFCGTGVILLEASLMGYSLCGTDIDKRMVDYSQANLDWLGLQPEYELTDVLADIAATMQSFAVGDATTMQWGADIDFVACETYLGRPFTTPPSADVLAQTVSECNTILKKFLRNAAVQLGPGKRLCLAVPAWQLGPGHVRHLPLLDDIGELGYNRISFQHAADTALVYAREDQIVARQLLVLVTK